MVRLAQILVLVVLATGTASAQTCPIEIGSYVDTDISAAVVPGLVMNTAGDPCWADVRLLAQPEQPFDPYTHSFYQHQLEALAGPPPYDKPNGCPWMAGDKVDLKDQYNVWHPGIINAASRDCGYLVDYWIGQQQKQFSAYHVDLRAATLPMPDLTVVPVGPTPEVIVQACTNGTALSDDDSYIEVKRSLIDAANERRGADFAYDGVGFESVVEAPSLIAAPGSDTARRYPDALADSVVHRYRLLVTLCEEDKLYGKPPYVVRYRFDHTCFDDIFGDLLCTIDSTKTM